MVCLCVCVLVELNRHTDISEIQKDIIALSKKKRNHCFGIFVRIYDRIS